MPALPGEESSQQGICFQTKTQRLLVPVLPHPTRTAATQERSQLPELSRTLQPATLTLISCYGRTGFLGLTE